MNQSKTWGILIVILLTLTIPMSLFAQAPKPPTGFTLVYDFWGSEFPEKNQFTLNESGVFKWVMVSGSGYREYIASGQFSDKEVGDLVDALVGRLKFFSLPAEDPNFQSKMDASTEFLTFTYQGKSSKVGGYGVYHNPIYKPLITTLYDLVKRAKVLADRPLFLTPADGFTLEYTSEGSELPVKVEFFLLSTGSYTYQRTIYGDLPRPISGKLSPPDLAELADVLIRQNRFFDLPRTVKNQGPELMDASTSFLALTYQAKFLKIGGYNARSLGAYGPVFAYFESRLDELVKGSK